MSDTFRERLKEIRTEKGLTQKQIADKLGLSHVGYGAYERGTSNPELDTIILLCKALDVSADYLLGLSETKYVPYSDIASTTGLSEQAIEYLTDVQDYSRSHTSTKEKINIINKLIEDAESLALLRQEYGSFIYEGNRGDASEPYYPGPFKTKVLEELNHQWFVQDTMSLPEENYSEDYSKYIDKTDSYTENNESKNHEEYVKYFQERNEEEQLKIEFFERDKDKIHLLDKIISYISFNPEHVNLRRGQYSETLSFEHSLSLMFGEMNIRFPSKESGELIDYALIQEIIAALKSFKKKYTEKK